MFCGENEMQDFDKLWDYNKPDETEEKFLKILDKTLKQGWESYIGQLYTQLARTQGLQKKWDEAHRYLDKAKSLLDKADKVTEVRYLLELGRTQNSSGDKKGAYDTFLRAWKLAKSIQADGYAVDAGHMLAIASETPEDTLDWNLKSLDYAEKSNQESAQKWLGSLYNNLGWTYFDNGDYKTALDMFEKALTEREKQGNIGNVRIAKWCIAKAQRKLGEVEPALKTQLTLLDEYRAENSEDEYVYEELSFCYQALGDKQKSSHYANLAYQIFSKQDGIPKPQLEALQALI